MYNLEHVYSYLGCQMDHANNKYIDKILSRFTTICGMLKNKTRQDTRIKPCNNMFHPILLYGSECWVLKMRTLDKKRQRAEMLFLRIIKGCTRIDLIRNDVIQVGVIRNKTPSYIV